MIDFIASKRLTIGALTGLLVLGLAIVTFPQTGGTMSNPAPAWAGLVAALGLDAVTRSALFLAAVTLFYLNLTARLYLRLYRGRRLTRPALGMLVMHGAIYCFLVGALLTRSGRFDGALLLTEGQTFANERTVSGYNQYLDAGPETDGLILALREMAVTRDGRGTVTDLRARLEVEDGSGKTRTVESRVNHPAEVAGLSFFIRKYGLAPKLTITTAAGEPVLDAFVNLHLLGGRVDEIPLDNFCLRLQAGRRSEAEAGLWLACQPAGGEYGEPVYLAPGGRLDLPNGMALHLGEIRRWAQLDVSRDPGFLYIVIGSLLLVAGMVVRWFPLQGVASNINRLWTLSIQNPTPQKTIRIPSRPTMARAASVSGLSLNDRKRWI